MRVVFISLLFGLALSSIQLAIAQNQGNNVGGKQTVTIRGKRVGSVTVSPALQESLENKTGKRPDPDQNSGGPNAFVSKHTVVRLSPYATKATDKK